MNLNFQKLNGLVPAIIQDFSTKQVLMLGFMNEEAYKKTLKSNFVWFYSRSKQRLWQKGESSGNKLEVMEIKEDCDKDSLLILVKPYGPTCHTGKKSCFALETVDLYELFKIIQDRKELLPDNSYTTSLFEDGLSKILTKVSEESDEVVQAARNEGKQRLVEESCDLIYHLWALLVSQGIEITDVERELNKRRK